METFDAKTKYESGKLHGVYRCKKRNGFIKKIPHIDKPEMPDATGIIISGILNYGNSPDMIRLMARQCLGEVTDISIPYEERNFARTRFVRDVITGKLTGTNRYRVEDLIGTFYDFMDMPTDRTKQLQAEADIRDINRYLTCEYRTPVITGEPVLRLCDSDFICQHDMIFSGTETVVTGKHKEGRKWVNDTMDVPVVETVKIFPGKPQVKEFSKILDAGTSTRLELYVMLKAAEAWAKEHGADGNVVLKASYYYLEKDREDDKNFSSEFFGKGGNVVSLQAKLGEVDTVNLVFQPQIKAFLAGASVDADKCQNCQVRALCHYKDIVAPLTEEEKGMPGELPELSTAQAKAANALEGNIRVIATAGSGKTTTMAYRILNLLKSGIAPEKIGCFTFTNAGAAEMSDRIRGYCALAGIDADLDKMTVSTIHAFGDSLLKKYYGVLGYARPPVLINEIQKTKTVEKILSENPVIEPLADKYKNFYLDLFKAKGILELMKDYFEQIMDGVAMADFMRNNKVSYETAAAVYDMYRKYDACKKEMCLIDHSDQERGVLKLLKLKPDLFDEVGIEHISVDEYQDTSNVQFAIIDAMRKAKCCKSLFIVGDDDQSIYGFRDANVELIQKFPEMTGEKTLDIHLMENRRSTPEIVWFADRVIDCNADRIPKNPVAVKSSGERVDVLSFESRNAEQDFIVGEVKKLTENGHPENSIAILAPTNSELLDYAERFDQAGIHTVSINPEPVLENTRVSAAVSLVKFILSNNEFHGMNYVNVRNGGVPWTDAEIGAAVKKLQEETAAVHTVAQLFQMFDALDPKKDDEIYQDFLEDIRTAKKAAVSSGKLREVCEYVLDFERFGKKQTARKEKAYAGVVLSTMHSAKGKEWPVVFCSVSRLHGRNMTREEIPEKNRLLFVAATRAQEKLYVTGVDTAFSSVSTGSVQNLFLRECMDAVDLLRKVS